MRSYPLSEQEWVRHSSTPCTWSWSLHCSTNTPRPSCYVFHIWTLWRASGSMSRSRWRLLWSALYDGKKETRGWIDWGACWSQKAGDDFTEKEQRLFNFNIIEVLQCHEKPIGCCVSCRFTSLTSSTQLSITPFMGSRVCSSSSLENTWESFLLKTRI